MRRMIFGVMAITSVAAMALAADSGIGTRADADALQTKLVQIATNGLAQKPVSRKTPVTEREVNAFLRTHASESLPQGVIDPLVTILADGHLTARAMVDLDEVPTRRSVARSARGRFCAAVCRLKRRGCCAPRTASARSRWTARR